MGKKWVAGLKVVKLIKFIWALPPVGRNRGPALFTHTPAGIRREGRYPLLSLTRGLLLHSAWVI